MDKKIFFSVLITLFVVALIWYLFSLKKPYFSVLDYDKEKVDFIWGSNKYTYYAGTKKDSGSIYYPHKNGWVLTLSDLVNNQTDPLARYRQGGYLFVISKNGVSKQVVEKNL